MRDILLIANNDWHGLWFQRQELARRFSGTGHRVWYVNRTPQRWPTLRSALERLHPPEGAHSGRKAVGAIHVVTPFWLPPTRWLRPLNRALVRRTLARLRLRDPVVITYVPTFNVIDVIDQVAPDLVAYVNVHNYDADVVLRDVLASERILARRSDVLLADSQYNVARLAALGGGRSVLLAEPGVDYEGFSRAFRGDELQRLRSLYYFGGVGPHLDLSLFAELSKSYDVTFCGAIARSVRKQIPPTVRIMPPVSNSELPVALKEADALCIFYKPSPYIDGVMPAKIYECLATRKPLLTSGLSNLESISGAFYDVRGDAQKAACIIASLPRTETPGVVSRRLSLARKADWSNRFGSLYSALDRALREKGRRGLAGAPRGYGGRKGGSSAAPCAKVAVIVVGYNEAAVLARCLDSVLLACREFSECTGELVETLFVDSHSTDGSVRIATDKGIRVALAPREFHTCANGRMTGLLLTRSELVMFVDGDMEMDPQWLIHGTTFLRESPHACGVSGLRDDMRQTTGAFQLIRNYHGVRREVELVDRDVGGAFLLRRSAIEAAGGLEPDLAPEEDLFMCCQLWAMGGRLYRINKPMITHWDLKVSSPGRALRHLVWNRRATVPGVILRRALFHQHWAGVYLWSFKRDLILHGLWLASTAWLLAAQFCHTGTLLLPAAALAMVTLLYLPVLWQTKRDASRVWAALFLRTAYLLNMLVGFTTNRPKVRFGAQLESAYLEQIQRVAKDIPGPLRLDPGGR